MPKQSSVRGTKRDGLRLWYAVSGLEKNSVGGREASTRGGRFPAQPLTAGSAPAALARNRLAAWPSSCGERFAALQRIRTVMKQELTEKTETPRVDKSVQTRRSSRLAPGLGMRAGRLERLRTKQLSTGSRWPTADKKSSWSARSAACLATSGGQRRTGAVIRGHNPVALAACAPRSPSALAAYRGQRRTKWRRGTAA